jgi:hypothetical protein
MTVYGWPSRINCLCRTAGSRPNWCVQKESPSITTRPSADSVGRVTDHLEETGPLDIANFPEGAFGHLHLAILGSPP